MCRISSTASRQSTPPSTSSSKRSRSAQAGSSRGEREREGGSGASRDSPSDLFSSTLLSASSSSSSPRNLRKRRLDSDRGADDETNNSGDEDEEGDGDTEASNSDDSDEKGAANVAPVFKPVASTKACPRIDWTPAMKAAYERALLLIPNIGQRTVKVNKYVAGRNGMIAEYIRRQTGTSLNRNQVYKYAQKLRRSTACATRIAAIHGATVDSANLERLITRDWSSVLGPDLFPLVKHQLVSRGTLAQKSSPRARKVRARQAAPSHPKKQKQYLPPCPTFSSSTVLSASSSLSAPLMPSPPPSRPSSHSTSLAPSDLAALLTSFAPSHDFTYAATVLFSAGLTSFDDLVSLLGAEQTTYESVVELMVKEGTMDEGEAKWVVFAMGEARREMEYV